jgi:hypothetical protein
MRLAMPTGLHYLQLIAALQRSQDKLACLCNFRINFELKYHKASLAPGLQQTDWNALVLQGENRK